MGLLLLQSRFLLSAAGDTGRGGALELLTVEMVSALPNRIREGNSR